MIDACGLTKRYGEVVAVDDLSLRVSAGETYALLGLNGAGKTTTIRMLLGMVRPTSGSVHVLGTAVGPGEHALWSRVGYLVETPAAYPELTVRENLTVAARLRGVSASRRVDEVVERLNLAVYADKRARTLSLGNAQRLGLAKALVHEPDLLILDEPANGLDPAGVVEIRELLRELSHDRGVTVVLSSHILTEVARLATRIGVIHRGRLVRELEAADLNAFLRQRLSVSTRDPEAAEQALTAAGFVPVRSENGALVLADAQSVREPDVVATVLVAAGCPPTRLVVEQDDLETFFLREVGS
ncbi:ABC-2 type transport system ATP-binding protein [Lentzea xinjiangensis]|uniref:ABC-2 type transport system ATP-binding protein n=1 Tax=Lentzea xinjiangensis TaxID=402600 RepID=A0A1H9W8G7_9PSEU|nr:ABC transporter ATP-binding protein [Lentzea xinjiangensis]SES30081.1 ABC-2 type transport system ATP-binding protein [Lentzea xinjiangensis]